MQTLPVHLFVVFGARGDLARRKLLPALARLSELGELERSVVLGVGRQPMEDDEFRGLVRSAVEGAGSDLAAFSRWCERSLHYHAGDVDPAGMAGLARCIEGLEREHELPGNRVFYLSIPPQAFSPVIEGLGASGLNQGPGWTRVVIEKPFGTDLESARALNALIQRWFDESQVYRIDHFLGKETVQNLLVFRFANPIIESIWNRDRIRDVQITVAEAAGIGGRGGYYDSSGALRDMVQNHLLQVLTHIAMEMPVAYDAESVHHEKRKILRSIRPIAADDVVFGRYAAGEVEGERARGYLEEEGVPPDSGTETFVALRLGLETWRWQGVPFYLRAGKRMARRLTEIAVTFRAPPVRIFESLECGVVPSDVLLIRLQPDEGFSLFLDVKRPGDDQFLVQKVPLQFSYGNAFGKLPDAYVALLKDVLQGDPTLFVAADEALDSWRLFDPVLGARPPVHPYAAGSWGPRAADDLLARQDHHWRTPVPNG
jgi:glucose-6-phosphate 1-dehydrogenase